MGRVTVFSPAFLRRSSSSKMPCGNFQRYNHFNRSQEQSRARVVGRRLVIKGESLPEVPPHVRSRLTPSSSREWSSESHPYRLCSATSISFSLDAKLKPTTARLTAGHVNPTYSYGRCLALARVGTAHAHTQAWIAPDLDRAPAPLLLPLTRAPVVTTGPRRRRQPAAATHRRRQEAAVSGGAPRCAPRTSTPSSSRRSRTSPAPGGRARRRSRRRPCSASKVRTCSRTGPRTVLWSFFDLWRLY